MMNPQYMGMFKSGMPKHMAKVTVGKAAAVKIWVSVKSGAFQYLHNKVINMLMKRIKPIIPVLANNDAK